MPTPIDPNDAHRRAQLAYDRANARLQRAESTSPVMASLHLPRSARQDRDRQRRAEHDNERENVIATTPGEALRAIAAGHDVTVVAQPYRPQRPAEAPATAHPDASADNAWMRLVYQATGTGPASDDDVRLLLSSLGVDPDLPEVVEAPAEPEPTDDETERLAASFDARLRAEVERRQHDDRSGDEHAFTHLVYDMIG